jgi:hypothetical protein
VSVSPYPAAGVKPDDRAATPIISRAAARRAALGGANTGQRASLRLLRHIGENKLVVQIFRLVPADRPIRQPKSTRSGRSSQPIQRRESTSSGHSADQITLALLSFLVLVAQNLQHTHCISDVKSHDISVSLRKTTESYTARSNNNLDIFSATRDLN